MNSDSPSIQVGINELRNRLRHSLDQHISPGSKIAFLEFPYDTNVGNHMMWLAAMSYFAEREADVGYVAHINAYRPDSLRRAVGDGLIVTCGGVGLGTLWPTHTELKRKMARDFRQNPILVLPSTLAFRNQAEQDEVRDVFSGHGNVTVMARDAESHRVIQETFRDVNAVLVPDAAFLLPFQVRRRPADHAIGWLARNDHEGIGYTPPKGVHVYDWAARSFYGPRDFPFAYGLLRLAGVATRLLNGGVSGRLAAASNSAARILYAQVSAEVLQAGNADLDRARVVVSDRFHAHILAILRHQPVVLLTDAFGKNRSSFETWTHRFPNVHLANTPAEALAVARTLAGE